MSGNQDQLNKNPLERRPRRDNPELRIQLPRTRAPPTTVSGALEQLKKKQKRLDDITDFPAMMLDVPFNKPVFTNQVLRKFWSSFFTNVQMNQLMQGSSNKP